MGQAKPLSRPPFKAGSVQGAYTTGGGSCIRPQAHRFCHLTERTEQSENTGTCLPSARALKLFPNVTSAVAPTPLIVTIWLGASTTTRSSSLKTCSTEIPVGFFGDQGTAGVYTDGWQGSLRVGLGRLCTLLNCGLGLWVALGSQQCTQMGGKSLQASDWGVCVHCWAAGCPAWPR